MTESDLSGIKVILDGSATRDPNYIIQQFDFKFEVYGIFVIETQPVFDLWISLAKTKMYVRNYVGLLIRTVRKYPDRYLPGSQVTIFLDSNGMIGFAPNGVRAGDEIWQDSSGDTLSIMRENMSGYEMVTQAAKKQHEPRTNLASDDFKCGNHYDHLLHCHLTFASLRSDSGSPPSATK